HFVLFALNSYEQVSADLIMIAFKRSQTTDFFTQQSHHPGLRIHGRCEGSLDMRVDLVCKHLRIGLSTGSESRLPGFSGGFGHAVYGLCLAVHTVRDAGNDSAEKIKGFAQIGV
ncbi:hypothetical protein, partial [Natronohydrobacter thiooxidans]|uniref:hypothetical protein n=1 Tax=Natronohydrobacter thiooxidans TaxID=87172 RepID=UPI001586FCED